MTHVFKLSTPLRTHDGDVTELKLKAPKAGLIVKYNDPFKIQPQRNERGETTGYEYVFDNASMMKFAVAMTGVDDLLLAELSVGDFTRLRAAIKDIIMDVVPDRDPSVQSVD